VPHQTGLGGDEQLLRIRVQRLADDLLADVRPVAVRRVDEVDAEVDRPAQYPDALGPVGRLTPDARSGQAHRAEAEAVHGLAGDLEGA
jgi:hypothetical protein